MQTLFKRLVLLLVVVLISSSVVSAKEIKFIQITDSHYASNGQEVDDREINSSGKILEKTVADINTIPNVDFVVFTGDNIDKANSKDLISFLKIANKLSVPYYVVIGNHEVFKSQKFDKVQYMKTVSKYSKNCRTKTPNYEFKAKGLVFLVVDGAKEVIPGAAGYYKKDTLKCLDKELTKYKNEKVVIFQHFPIVPPYYNRSHQTYNVCDYEAVLSKHSNVIGIFSGHYHANGETMQNGIYNVSTPALVVSPHDYKIVEIEFKGNNDYKIFTQLRHAE